MSPFWRRIPVGLAHQMAPLGVRLWSDLFPVKQPECHPFEWQGLYFPNRLGLAAGVDKNADLLAHWPRLGFGFMEIGTVTPYPQEPNPGQILDRDWENKNLWNKMGFPNAGMIEVSAKLATQAPFPIPLFINIGKNRHTSLENAKFDYQDAAKRLAPLADIVVMNVSSPNTPGLRDLQETKNLFDLVKSVVEGASGKPVLVKLSPDETGDSLRQSLGAATDAGALGFILTNTTLQRPPASPFPSVGGVSGSFLKSHSLLALKTAVGHFSSGKKPLLISAGGILTPEDAQERLDLGADLVQIYSAMVFEGPGFPARILESMQKRGEKL